MKISDTKEFSEKINSVLKNGGVISFVTDTVWGIGCLPDNKSAVDKIYSIKQRDLNKPLILMSDKAEHLMPYVQNTGQKAKEVMRKNFPGALTLIFDRSEKTPLFITANKDTVGVRVPDNRIFKHLCEIIDGHVLATTSANISGEPPALDYKTAHSTLSDLVDIIIEDEDDAAAGEPSTVAIVSDFQTLILRQGKVKI
ncbi:MAG: threonylcarbamoyl-AMP synthase [Candidatus Gastranaerophilales bacterium]|nr:threonylcarbamoyl-AMP synthase [Candidatus Gastranaerophilales bacterium]